MSIGSPIPRGAICRGVGHDVVQIRYDAPTSPDKLMNSYTHSVELGQARHLSLTKGCGWSTS